MIAAALVFIATRARGPGLDPDAMAYMGAATSLVRQGRMRVPTAHWDQPDSTSALSLWPPGYPMAIALPVYAGASPVQSARWINICAAGITAAVIVLLIAGPLSLPAGVVGAIAIFATPAVFDTHLSVLSEPLFIALMLLLLFVMVYARDRLVLMSVLATATMMVRYAGIAAVAAAVTWTLFDNRRDLSVRMRHAVTVIVLPAIIAIAWFTRTAVIPDRRATLELNLFGGWGATLGQARDTLAAWLAPAMTPGPLQWLVALVLAAGLVTFVVSAASDTIGNRRRRMRIGGVATLIGAASLLSFWYLVVIVLSRAFVGGAIPFDWRILAPLIVLLEIASVTAVAYWWRAYHFPLKASVAVLALVWLLAAKTATVNDALHGVGDRHDFAADRWRESPLATWVGDHASGHPLYSNLPSAVYFYAGRIARELPDSSNPGDVSGFADRLRANHGYLVGFTDTSQDLTAPAALANKIGLREVVRTADGAVWAADSAVASALPDSALAREYAADSVATDRRGER